MKIGFDAKRAFLNYSGLGNYSRTLIKSLSHYFPEHDYFAFSPKINNDPFTAFIQHQKNFKLLTPEKRLDKTFNSFWRSYKITGKIDENQLDIYHGLSNELPFNITKCKAGKVVTIHDLIFLRYPEYYSAIDRRIYYKKSLAACHHANAIIAISEQTKNDIVDFFNIPKEKIRVIYQSCDDVFYKEYSEKEVEKIRVKYQLPDRFLLYVGSIEERKNLLTVVKSLRMVDNISLVVIGRKKKYFRQVKKYISDNHLSHKVVFPENISNEELPLFYNAAEIFVYPSIFEGFGIPIIEALLSKVPVITSRGFSFTEAGGPQSSYINPENEGELAEQIQKILCDHKLRNQMIEKGFEYVQRFHPKLIASEMMNLYENLI